MTASYKSPTIKQIQHVLMSLTCPVCNHEKSDTLESRKITNAQNSLISTWKGYYPENCVVRRRHECRACGHRWSTLQLSFDDLNKLRATTTNGKIQAKTDAIQIMLKQIHSELENFTHEAYP